ncbi:MAG: alpha/beta hydrolase [Pseudomonadota bacterium]
MENSQPQFLAVGEGESLRRIAYLQQSGQAAGVMWLQGFKSDMVSTKASALGEWAIESGAALTRFDYSGHGQSEGRFEDGTVSAWLAEAEAVFRQLTQGPQILVGSSMGGYLTMLLQRRLVDAAPADARRIVGIVLIAPAWDMTEALMWDEFPEDVRNQILTTGTWERPSQYGEPYPITRDLIEDGRRHLFAGSTWTPDCPVRIIQGRLDPDVPFHHSKRLLEMMPRADVELIEVPDGEHRLSRPEDIDLLIRTIEAMRGQA